MTSVLVVEDEQHLADGLRFNLEAEGYSVKTVGDGESALSLLIGTPHNFELLVLDVMLPGKDGFAVAKQLRTANQFVPILMLTARTRPQDVMRGFESGADDYLPKPFDLGVFLARVNALLRRRKWLASTEQDQASHHNEELDRFHCNGREIDFPNLELKTKTESIRLTLMEADLLRYLITRQGKVVSRKALLEDVWGLNEDTDTRAIDNFIVRLRKYLEDDPSKPQHLLTVRGVGYRFVDEKNE